jgi:hypothetical protein
MEPELLVDLRLELGDLPVKEPLKEPIANTTHDQLPVEGLADPLR